MSTVVLSGSLGATSEMWGAQADALRGFEVVGVEHPGHGSAPMEDVPDVYVRYCEILREYDVRGRLGDIAAPTLAIAGAEDPTSPPEHLAAIAAEIAGAHVVVIPKAAHLVNVERANDFNEALLAHLA